ncbi:hypothetical protein NBRC116188_01580 [Oceaniserpentilla sp. 4NH20-0058]|uniref:pilus assembly FimT family protein n=1 Tax=Oceaniserpentilla sp. 4NH20-0058 TaxID=3127660 RepID=UPI0031059D50
MRRHNSGFTLIEILVVLVIIALLVSMASLNTSHDGRINEIKSEAEKLKFLLEASADEALFNNKNIGFEFAKTEFTPFSYEIQTPATTADSTSEDEIISSWNGYTGKYIQHYILPESMYLELSVEGQELQLPYVLKQDKKQEEIKPVFFMMASGEQTPIQLKIQMEDYDGYATVRGDGMGRFFYEVHNEEQ